VQHWLGSAGRRDYYQPTVDYIQVARDTIKRIGYDTPNMSIDYKGCAVWVAYDKQSPDIAQGVNKAYDDDLDQGAGDQGLDVWLMPAMRRRR